MEQKPEPAPDSPFLAALSSAARHQILTLSGALAPRLEVWAAENTMMRPERALPLALSVCAAAPFCPLEGLEAAARVSLFVFALDDFFDEGERKVESLTEVAVELKQVTRGRTTHGMTQPDLADGLAQVREGLSRYPLFQLVGSEWETAVCGTIDEMVQEARWREAYQIEGAAALPTWEAYLQCGRYSIGGPPHIWSTLITIGDPTTVDHLEQMHEMEALSSTCIRLANDLRSHQKEMLEGGVNSLLVMSQGAVIGGKQAARTAEEAATTVRGEIGSRLDALIRLGSRPVTHTGQPEAAIVDIARFVCEFYKRHDFHTYNSTNS